MNNDLISRSALLKRLEAYSTTDDLYGTIKSAGIAQAALIVREEIPAVDAVEVVRCKDCKHFRRNLENDTYCNCVGGLTDPEENDFCSYGERREDG